MIKNLLLPRFFKFQKYLSARDEFFGAAKIFLDANENPFGDNFENRYPPKNHDKLRREIANFYGVKSFKNVGIGNGSDEILDFLTRIFCAPEKDKIAFCPPTFEMYSVVANLNNLQKIEIPRGENFEILPEKICAQKAKILFLCSPNNPTGNSISREKISKICEKFSGMVVVDEAYADFCPEKSAVNLLEKYENLVIVKTFSKAFGLAGRRVGFFFAAKKIVDIFLAAKMPYNVNFFSADAAIKKLKNPEKVFSEIQKIKCEKNRVEHFLKKNSAVEKVFPSDANFFLVRFFDAEKIFQKLLKNGLVVRNFSKKRFLKNCLRISIGAKTENDFLFKILSKK